MKFKSAYLKFFYIGAEIVNKIIPFIALPVFANYLSKEEFGIISNFNVLFFIFNILVGLSSENYLSSKFFSLEPSERGKIIGQLCTVASASAIILIPVIFLFTTLIEKSIGINFTYTLFCLLASYSNFIIRLFLIFTRFNERHILFFLMQLAIIGLNIGMSVLAVIYMEDKLNARIISFTLAYVLIGFISFLLLKKIAELKIDQNLLRKIIYFGLPLIPYQLAKWARNGFDRIIITNLIGIGANGIYSYNFQIANVPSYIGNGLNLELTPQLFKELSKSKSDRPLKIIYQYWMIIFGAFSIYIISFLFLKQFVFVKDFKFDYITFSLILFGSLFHSYALLLNNFLFFWDKNAILTKITVSTSVIGGLINLFLTYYWGLYGSCIAFFFTEIFIFIYLFFYVRKHLLLS